jgi:two-component system CheB/CheR fusion protein
MAGLRHGKAKADIRRPSWGRILSHGPPDPLATGSDFLVVAIGASAGGLEACTKLISALPVPGGAAFILVQHLDPTHDSMMVDLLKGHHPAGA